MSFRSWFSDSLNSLSSLDLLVGAGIICKPCSTLMLDKLGLFCCSAANGSVNSKIAVDRSLECLKVVRTWWWIDFWNFEKSWLLISLLVDSASIDSIFGTKRAGYWFRCCHYYYWSFCDRIVSFSWYLYLGLGSEFHSLLLLLRVLLALLLRVWCLLPLRLIDFSYVFVALVGTVSVSVDYEMYRCISHFCYCCSVPFPCNYSTC